MNAAAIISTGDDFISAFSLSFPSELSPSLNCSIHYFYLQRFTKEKYIIKPITFSQTVSEHMKSSLLCQGSPTGEGKLHVAE